MNGNRRGEQGPDGPGFGGLPDPVDLSGYAVPAGAGVLAGVPAGAGTPMRPGTAAAALRGLDGTSDRIREVGDACGQLSDAELADAAGVLLRVREAAERSLVLALADATQRGVVQASDSGGARQWLRDRAGFLEPAEASRLTVAGEALNRPENAVVRAVFVAGGVSAAMLVTVLAEVPKAMVALPDAVREEVLGYYLQLVRPGATRADLRGLTRRVIAEFGDEQAAGDEEKGQRAESLSWRELPSGLVEVLAVLSPGHAAQLIEAITALSAPQPTQDPCTGATARDPRTPGKRRADALMELVGAAARCAEADAMRSTAPGRDRPPGWCEAHHITPWWAGGPTTTGNGTLLCKRHHTIVHTQGYLATITDNGVVWDLTPDRMNNLPPASHAAA